MLMICRRAFGQIVTNSGSSYSNKRYVKKHLPSLVVLLLYIVVASAFIFSKGAIEGGDSSRYIEGATKFWQGEALQGKAASYMGYIAFVALLKEGLGLSWNGVIVAQYIVLIFAVFSLLLVSNRTSFKWPVALGLVLFALYPDGVMWNSWILTDGLFISSLIFLTAAMFLRMLTRNWLSFTLVLLALGLSVSIRPTGWAFPLGVLPWLLATCVSSGRNKWLVSVGVLSSLLLVVFLSGVSRKGNSQEGISSHFYKGTILWNYDEWHMQMPATAIPMDDSFSGLIEYVWTHPVESSSLVMARGLALLFPMRSYYSLPHNLILMIYLLFTYGIIIFRWKALLINPFATILWIGLGVNTCLSLATFIVSDGRWTAYNMVFISFLAGVACLPNYKKSESL